jgi:hypothetical protein
MRVLAVAADGTSVDLAGWSGQPHLAARGQSLGFAVRRGVE